MTKKDDTGVIEYELSIDEQGNVSSSGWAPNTPQNDFNIQSSVSCERCKKVIAGNYITIVRPEGNVVVCYACLSSMILTFDSVVSRVQRLEQLMALHMPGGNKPPGGEGQLLC